MARFLVELLINAAGEPEARAVFDNIGAAAGRSSKAVDSASLRSEASLRRTAEAAEKLKTQLAETTKSKSFVSDMEALNKKLKEQAEHWKRGEAGIAAWAEKERAAAEAQRILTAQVRAGVSADSEHGKRIAELIRQHNIYQTELDETKRKEAARISAAMKGGGVSGSPDASALLGGIAALTGGGGPLVSAAQNVLFFKASLDGLKDGTGGVVAGIGRLAASLGPLGLGLVATTVAIGAVIAPTTLLLDYLAGVVKEGTETQVMLGQLNNTLRSNGSYSGLSARAMNDMAESLALLSGGMDDPIIKAETIISRFDRIGGDVFPRVIKAAVNMSRALGKSVEESAEAISRALSGTQGLRGLREAGITVDPAQKKYLENLLETNRLTEYQTTLLGILEQKLGDAAEMYGNTLPGAVGRARFVYGEFRESIASEVIPALEDLFVSLIDSAGGWETVKSVVVIAGHEIGDAIRKTVYGAGVLYHEWQKSTDELAAGILEVFMTIVDRMGKFAGVMAELPGPQSTVFRTAQVEIEKGYASMAKSQAAAIKSGMEHERQINRLTRGLGQHRQAIEGEDTVYKGLGATIDRVTKSQAQLVQLEAERQEQLRHLMELDKLASTRGLPLGERVTQEARINREHEYRVSLLKLQTQYGEKLGKALADQERALKDYKSSVELKLKVALVPSIKLDSTITKQFDQSMKSFLVTFKQGEEITRANAAAWDDASRAQEEWLQDFSESWRASFATARERAEDEIKAIENAIALGVEQGGLSVIEGERAIAQVRSELIQSQISEWGSLFSSLGSMFGGLFQRISNAISNVQAAYKTGSQLGGQMSQMGMASAATGSAMGYMGATVAVMYEIYKAVSAKIAKDKARRWGDVTSVEVVGGEMSSPSYRDNRGGKEFSIALRNLIKDIEAALGAILDDLPNIVVRARKDGKEFSTYVAGVWVGTFRDAQQAMEAGVAAAITQADFSSISKEFATALKASIGLTLDEVERNIEVARKARRARIGDTGEQYVDMSDSWRRDIEAAQALGLAIEDMIDARKRELNALKNSVLGIDTTVSDQLRALSSLNKGIAESAGGMRISIQRQIDAILKEIGRLSNAGKPTGQGGGGGGGAGTIGGGPGKGLSYFEADSEEISRLRDEVARLISELEKIPDALSADELHMGIFDALYKPFEGTNNKYSKEAEKWARMRVDIEYELVRLELIKLGLWEQYAQMFTDSLNRARDLAGESVRGGGRRSGQRAEVKDFIKDRRFELDNRGLTDFQVQMRELNREYDEQAAKLGKSGKGLKELNELRAQEIAILQAEQREKVVKSVDEFLGLVTPFDKVRETAADLIKEIEGSPFGSARKAAEIERVLDGIDAQIREMSKRAAVSLFGEMLADMEAAGATEGQMAEARRQMAILEHGLKMAHYALEIETLRVKGDLTEEELKALQDAYDYLATIDPTKNPNVPNVDTSYSSSGTLDIFAEFEDAKQRILDQIEAWNLSPLGELTKKATEMSLAFDKLMVDVEKLKPLGWDFTSAAIEAFNTAKNAFIDEIFDSIRDEVEESSLVRRLREIGVQFDDIYSALTKIGASQADLQEAELLRLKSIQAAISDWLSPITEYLDESRFDQLSTLTGEDKFRAAQEEFRAISQLSMDELIKMSPDELVRIGDLYRELGRDYTAGEGYRFIDSEVTGFLRNLRDNLPGFVTGVGAGSAPLGSVSRPMAIDAAPMTAALSATTDAVNTGNTLLLSELRASLVELRRHSGLLKSIDTQISASAFSSAAVA